MSRMAAGFTPEFQLWSTLAAVGLFAAAVYLTRAKPRRITASLIGTLLFTAGNVLWDVAAHKAGWWSYPTQAGSVLPFPVYFAQDLVWSGGFGLLGWRIERRFGLRAVAAYLLLLVAVAVCRDFAWAFVTKAISFGSGPAPILADCVCWASLLSVAQVTMRLISGSSTHDKTGAGFAVICRAKLFS